MFSMSIWNKQGYNNVTSKIFQQEETQGLGYSTHTGEDFLVEEVERRTKLLKTKRGLTGVKQQKIHMQQYVQYCGENRYSSMKHQALCIDFFHLQKISNKMLTCSQ